VTGIVVFGALAVSGLSDIEPILLMFLVLGLLVLAWFVVRTRKAWSLDKHDREAAAPMVLNDDALPGPPYPSLMQTLLSKALPQWRGQPQKGGSMEHKSEQGITNWQWVGKPERIGIALVTLFTGVLCWGAPTPSPVATLPANPNTFRIVAESEVQSLQDAGILDDFTQETGIKLEIAYWGPVDIRNAVSSLSEDNPKTVDAYWPGSSLWLPGSSGVEPVSVMKTYVVLAVDPESARELGWDTHKGITAADLVDGVRSGKINLAMTSASQSTPGATFYLAMYTALTDKRVLTSEDLEDPQVFDDLKAMLAGVERSAGSLDHLKQVFVDDKVSGANRFNAIVIYESLAIEMNRELVAQGRPPMTIFYVTGATAVADVPIRFVDNGDDSRREQYDQLVGFLTRPDIQQKIQALGWRTNPIGMVLENADLSEFNPDWGINTTTEFREMVFPKPFVALAALNQYQSLFRKPSFTVYCLDYSASMESNGGREQMIDAMDLLLDQERASEVLLQATPQDVTVVYGFSDMTVQIGNALEGNDPGALKALSTLITTRGTGSGTALFDCVKAALAYIADRDNPKYGYSVIAMTDGQSNTGATATDFENYYRGQNLNIPVYGIAFGSADVSQMSVFVNTGGAVYDGRLDVAAAFRQAKGNN